MQNRWDVIIVGARCAGAALAGFLAQRGARVLVLERDAEGSDMPMSTHLIHPAGMDQLDALGVGDAAREGAEPIRRPRIAANTVSLVSPYPEGRAAYCVRRGRLDGLLQAAARKAGATLEFGTRVVDLLRDGERVTGVVTERNGEQSSLRAELVVGADGSHSLVAKLTGVESYLSVDSPRGGYWFYWPKTRAWNEGFHAEHDALIAYEGSDLRYVFPTNDDQLLMVAAPDAQVACAWGRDYRQKYIDFLRASEHTRALTEGTAPLGKGIGLLKTTFFYRRPIGPGFALVGDAGHTKDFATGQGISEALISARAMADAIMVGTDAAMLDFWRERDLHSLPYYFEANRLGAVEVNDPMFRLVLQKLAADPKKASRIAEIMDRKRSPLALASTPELFGWLLSALVRGQFDVWSSFISTGKQMAGFARTLSERKQAFEGKSLRLALPAPKLAPSPSLA